jgi:hypothetical protein
MRSHRYVSVNKNAEIPDDGGGRNEIGTNTKQ